jgi:hypothetical protein
LINENFERSIIILGLERMRNGHAAEETKQAIEDIVNRYNFDKTKIKVVSFPL